MSYKAQNYPKDCNSINDVRNEIDAIDKEVIELLGKRYQYVKRVVDFKEKTKDSIVAADRREAVISERRDLAVKNGICPDAIEQMYRNLIKHFIEEEMKLISK